MYLNTRFVIILFYLILINLFVFFIRYSDYIDSFLCFNCVENDLSGLEFDYIIGKYLNSLGDFKLRHITL